MRVKDAVGRFGEDLAAGYLREHGLTVLARNWRCREGELDIVARDGDEIVIVEVKTRSTAAYGDPAEAMTSAKIARIHRLALRWVAEYRDRAAVPWPVRLRFDVISIIRRTPDGIQLRHLRAAF